MKGLAMSRRRLLVGAGVGAAALAGVRAGTTTAQGASWRAIAPASGAPSPRWDHHLAANTDGDQLLLFGGRDQDGNALGDAWLFDIESSRWSPVGGEAPSPRFGSATALDPGRNQLWLFGGQAGADFYNDTWAFDFGAGRWTLHHDATNTAPTPRYGLGAAYTADGQFVISHGFTFAGRFDDTWQFDPKSGTWLDITPAGGRPLNRCLHEIVTTQPDGQIVLYGGCSSGYGPCPQGDLWSLDRASATWTELTPASSPPGRSNPSLVWIGSAGGALLFGGLTDAGRTADLWTGSFDAINGFTWTALSAEGDAPSPRSSHDAVAIGQTMYLFGGITDAGATNDLLALDLAT